MDGTLTCPQCEREVDDSLTWCPFCGAELRPEAADESPSAIIAAELDDEPEASPEEGDPFAPATKATPASGTAGTSPSSGAPKALAAGLAVLLLVGGAVGWYLFMRDDDRGDLGVGAVSPGDCWDDTDTLLGGGEVQTLPEVPCSDPHDNEVFAVRDLAIDGSYPGTFLLESLAFEMCLDEFDRYVATPYRESPLDIYTLFPTPTSWLDGDRGVICSLYMLDTSQMTGSQVGSTLRMPTPALDTSGMSTCPELADATIGVAQGFIDYFDGLSEEELASPTTDIPEEMFPIMKSESMLISQAIALDCSFEDLNQLVSTRAGALTYETEIGGYVVDEILESGFFATE